jgi:hypothetical protein
MTRETPERTRFFQWLVIIGLVNLVVLSVMAMGLIANFNSTTNELEEVQTKQALFSQKLRISNIISCERGGTLFAYEIIDAGQSGPNAGDRQSKVFNLLRIRDCQQTEDEGRRVFLSDAEAKQYITEVAAQVGILNWDKRQK